MKDPSIDRWKCADVIEESQLIRYQVCSRILNPT